MHIHPQDLGRRLHQALLLMRTAQPATPSAQPLPDNRKRWWDGLMIGSARLTPEQQETALEVSRNNVGCAVFAALMVGGALGIVPLAAAEDGELPRTLAPLLSMIPFLGLPTGVFGLIRRQMRLNHRAVTAAELDALQPLCRDDLERELLAMVKDAVELRLDPQVWPEVRAAINGLANAVERLPRVDTGDTDSAALRTAANDLLVRAQSELDETTAASIRRRALAHLQQADATDHCSLIARRSSALREEVLAQVRALRTSMVAMQSQTADYGHLSRLAEAARDLAGEAVNVASARAEIDALHTPAAPQPEVQPLGLQQ